MLFEYFFIGLVIGFVFYELTDVSPGGVIAPAYCALYVHEPMRIVVTIAIALAVWGIMDAFADIGRMGSANLAVVAPGISEALITTAMGLFAAIPAAVFFNFFSSRVKVLSAMMDDFALEFLNICERNFT